MKTIAKYLGGGPDSDNQMMKVFDLETKIATVSTVFRHLVVLVFYLFSQPHQIGNLRYSLSVS